tara:strand:+ start:2972 stop:3367 length:396 start_codon:yes stop_codon:yes gene_type:complete
MNIVAKITLISSVILNSFLLIYLFGLIPFFLFISAVTNLAFLSYLSYLLRERTDLQNDFFDLLGSIETYSNKLVSTYELEMFYGDDTLEDLLRNSKILVNKFYDYEDKYYTEPQGNNEDNDTEAQETQSAP